MEKLADYDRLIGMARGKSGKGYLNCVETGDRLMRAVILDAATALGDANYKHLNAAFKSHESKYFGYFITLLLAGSILLFVLILTQYFILLNFRRIINVGLATISLFLVLFVGYSAYLFISTESNLINTKKDAFDSIYALSMARSIAYDANTDESIYLLDYEHPSMKPQREAAFFEKVNILFPVNQLAKANDLIKARTYKDNNITKVKDIPELTGYFGEEIKNITYPGELDAALSMLHWWCTYMKIDAQTRVLEVKGLHKEAVELNVGTANNESNWAFDNFDRALGQVLSINQKQFDAKIANGISQLKYYPYILISMLVLGIIGIIIGIKVRIREYTVI